MKTRNNLPMKLKPQHEVLTQLTVTVTVTESFVLRPTLKTGGSSQNNHQSSAGRMEQKCSQSATKTSGRLQQLQLCRQRVPCSRCGDRESPVADSSTCRRHDEVARRRSTQHAVQIEGVHQPLMSPFCGSNSKIFLHVCDTALLVS